MTSDEAIVVQLLSHSGIAVSAERAAALVAGYRALLATDEALRGVGMGGLEPFPPAIPDRPDEVSS